MLSTCMLLAKCMGWVGWVGGWVGGGRAQLACVIMAAPGAGVEHQAHAARARAVLCCAPACQGVIITCRRLQQAAACASAVQCLSPIYLDSCAAAPCCVPRLPQGRPSKHVPDVCIWRMHTCADTCSCCCHAGV
jgi:hypothetical protein